MLNVSHSYCNASVRQSVGSFSYSMAKHFCFFSHLAEFQQRPYLRRNDQREKSSNGNEEKDRSRCKRQVKTRLFHSKGVQLIRICGQTDTLSVGVAILITLLTYEIYGQMDMESQNTVSYVFFFLQNKTKGKLTIALVSAAHWRWWWLKKLLARRRNKRCDWTSRLFNNIKKLKRLRKRKRKRPRTWPREQRLRG